MDDKARLKQSKRRLLLAMIAFVLAIILTVSLCFAWIYINEKVQTGLDGMLVVARPFALGYIQISVDGSQIDINEFTGLMPGSKFDFEIKVERQAAGDLFLRVDFMAVTGDDFVGSDKNTYNMTQLFCTTPLDAEQRPIGATKYFSEAVGDKLNLFESFSMPKEVDEVLIQFRIAFTNDKIPLKLLTPEISKKAFNIGNIYISEV